MWDALIITPFINALLFIYNLVGNFGVAIILFTILIRLITHPLMVSQIKGSKAMAAMQQDKRWIDTQAKYKGDKEKLAVEQQKLLKELGQPLCILSTNAHPVPNHHRSLPGCHSSHGRHAPGNDEPDPTYLSGIAQSFIADSTAKSFSVDGFGDT